MIDLGTKIDTKIDVGAFRKMLAAIPALLDQIEALERKSEKLQDRNRNLEATLRSLGGIR